MKMIDLEKRRKRHREYYNRNRNSIILRRKERLDRVVAITCARCGKLVLTNSMAVKYCSIRCRVDVHNELAKKRRKKNRVKMNLTHLHKQPRTVAVTCIECCKIILTNWYNTKYCKSCKKKVQYKQQTEYQHLNREKINFRQRQLAEKTVAVTCIVCGKLILCPHGSTRYCSKECEEIERKRTHPYHYLKHYGYIVAVTCVRCGEVTPALTKSKKYCSLRCQRKAYNVRHPNHYREARNIQKFGTHVINVAVTCIICGEIIPIESGRCYTKFCKECKRKVNQGSVPKYIKEKLNHCNILNMPKDLIAWKNILDYRRELWTTKRMSNL